MDDRTAITFEWKTPQLSQMRKTGPISLTNAVLPAASLGPVAADNGAAAKAARGMPSPRNARRATTQAHDVERKKKPGGEPGWKRLMMRETRRTR
ncbi:hypothetical protein CKO23_09155 [Thiocystis violacea]|nr:hypothetical protein [Thiocystis violacea]